MYSHELFVTFEFDEPSTIFSAAHNSSWDESKWRTNIQYGSQGKVLNSSNVVGATNVADVSIPIKKFYYAELKERREKGLCYHCDKILQWVKIVKSYL